MAERRGRYRLDRWAVVFLLLVLWGVRPGRVMADDAPPIPPGYQAVAENERFRLYVDPTTLAFKLFDRRSGYLWHSGVDELEKGDRLNRAWHAFARSGLSIEYLDAKAVSKRVAIANSEHTLEVTPIPQGVAAQVTFLEYGISVGLRLQLEEEGVRVEVPFASIREENPAYRLGLVNLYPFLGATRGGQTPGYMVLPDGTGSLIHFADNTKAKNIFYGRYYGPDLGMIASLPFDPEVNRPYPLSFPVFGMVHGEGQNAFIAVIEKGAAYGELVVHPAGILTNFNFIHNAFIYNESYFQATNRAGAGVTTVQSRPNAFDVVVHYRFLSGPEADYVGLARSYQRYLVAKGVLRPQSASTPHIGIRLEFLGGDKEKVLLWHRFIPMTTVAQMAAILADLEVTNPEVIYYGWQPLGASSMPPRRLALEEALGDLEALREVIAAVTAAGGHFALYLDPQAALAGEKGYSPRNDLALAITNRELQSYNRHHVHFLFTATALERRFRSLAADVADRLGAGLALDGIGWTLYGDFRKSRPLNREETIAAYQALLAAAPTPLAFYRPHDYLWGLARAYYDMPLGDSGYVYTTETVPFLPIVLAGYLPYYGPALNFSPDLNGDILRQVDFGIYPSYFLTHESTARMLTTRSRWIYTSSVGQWSESVRQTYRRMDALLGPVRGWPIVARQRLAEGVFATTYANGRQIVVNYTDRPFAYAGTVVPARDAVLQEVAP